MNPLCQCLEARVARVSEFDTPWRGNRHGSGQVAGQESDSCATDGTPRRASRTARNLPLGLHVTVRAVMSRHNCACPARSPDVLDDFSVGYANKWWVTTRRGDHVCGKRRAEAFPIVGLRLESNRLRGDGCVSRPGASFTQRDLLVAKDTE